MEETQLYFPLFVSLKGKKCLIIGSGDIGTRRAAALSEFQCDVQVIAPEISEAMKRLQDAGKVQVSVRKYQEGDCKGAFLVVAATNDRTINRQIGWEGKAAGAFVSVADAKEECTFFFPGIAVNRQEKTVIGVTACGQNHALAKKITDDCRKIVRDFE
ncbi:MAG: bifunctional precorrin-2 dehydrogenase/sirohydrochlorin ferrochelatase [Lachnospiraceae bacterium]|nr:bifunctional precorrin-2 dehydrogenase/sirohydrochlorin ferrochelatase [Lachnospiraceae bacterium]